jgi:hypothetical protein
MLPKPQAPRHRVRDPALRLRLRGACAQDANGDYLLTEAEATAQSAKLKNAERRARQASYWKRMEGFPAEVCPAA